MAQTEHEQEQMFHLQQRSDAFSEKMQTMASIGKSKDEGVKAIAPSQDINQ